MAVKEISLDTLNKYEKSIKNETDIMKNSNHPYIVKLYDPKKVMDIGHSNRNFSNEVGYL